MALSLSTDTWGAMLSAIKAQIDAAATPSKLLFYSGARPPNGGAATALQATVQLAQPCGTIAGSVLTFVVGMEGFRVDDKTITWCRFVDGDGKFVGDANVGMAGGGADISISNINGFVGGIVRLTAGTFGAP